MTDVPTGAVPDDEPRRRLAAALRPIITMTVAATFSDEFMTAAAERLEEFARTLEEEAGPKLARPLPDMDQGVQEIFPTSPIMGLANPIAPPVVVHVVDGVDGGLPEIRADAWFDWAYEGPPNCVHGGVIAETFDEMLGAAIMVAGNPGMTGTLTIRYRKPTPLRTPLRIEARCLDRDGRKIRTWGGIYHGDRLTAEAEGLFIEVRPTQFPAIDAGDVDNAGPSVLGVVRAGAAPDPPEPSWA